MIVAASYGDSRVRALLQELAAYYVREYGAHDLDDDDPAQYAAPRGGCLLGYEDGTPVAVGCWRRHDATTCELRRFYVAPTIRRRGVGRRVLAAVLDDAREAGYRRAVCATVAGDGLAGLDVRRIALYGPHAALPGVGCYEVRLAERRLPAGVSL